MGKPLSHAEHGECPAGRWWKVAYLLLISARQRLDESRPLRTGALFCQSFARGALPLHQDTPSRSPIYASLTQSTIPAPQVDYCAVLGVERDASPEEITRAWRRLVLLHHPDKRGGDLGVQETQRPPDHQHDAGSYLASGPSPGDAADIRLINEARFVLSDPERRRQWQEAFKSEDFGNQLKPANRNEPHIFREISLGAFEPHHGTRGSPATSASTAAAVFSSESIATETRHTLDEEDDPAYYTYPCRCSAQFVITREDLEAGVDVVGCEGCGEWVRVGYEEVDEDEAE